MGEENLKTIIISYMHKQTGYGPKLVPRCEFEDLYIIEQLNQDDKSIIVEFRYDFDEDGFSQYDKNVLFKGKFIIHEDGKIEEIYLYKIHHGVDARGPRSGRQFEYRPDLFQ